MLAYRNTKNELNIFSASALDKFPGHIFIEAHRDFHVKEAIKGLKNLNINTVKIIPVKEVTQVFSPDPTKQPSLEVGQFVRIKKGIYAEDLAVVLDFDDGYKRIKIKHVPRLAQSYNDDNEDTDKEALARSKKMRPAKRFFNPEEYPEAKSLESKKRGSQIWAFDNKRFENGLIVRTIWLKNLKTDNIIPTLEEVEVFQKSEVTKDGRDNIFERAKKTIEESKKFVRNLEKGDRVQIIQGDLNGLKGIVTEVTEGQVKV
jgi:transcription elongation factor SPT5